MKLVPNECFILRLFDDGSSAVGVLGEPVGTAVLRSTAVIPSIPSAGSMGTQHSGRDASIVRPSPGLRRPPPAQPFLASPPPSRRMPPSRERGPSSPLPPLSSLPLGSLLCSACPDSRSLLSGTQWLVRLVDHPPRPIAHPKRARPRLELSADVTARSCPALPTHRALMPHHQKTAVPRRTAVVTRSKASDQERQDHAAQRCRLDE